MCFPRLLSFSTTTILRLWSSVGMSLLLRSLRSIRSDPLVYSSSILVRRRGFVVDFAAAVVVVVVDFAVVRMIYLFLLRLLII